MGLYQKFLDWLEKTPKKVSHETVEKPKVVLQGAAIIHCRSDGKDFSAIAPLGWSVSGWYDNYREAVEKSRFPVPDNPGEVDAAFWVTQGIQSTRNVRVMDFGFVIHENIACLPQELEDVKELYPNGKSM